MPEQRMTLEEAGKLLGGLHPNTVRNRAAKGKYHYEKDNTGKWFVFLDPEKIANDKAKAPRLEVQKSPLEPPMEVIMEPPIVSSLKALEATIQTLNQELEATRAERDALRLVADERREVAHRLEVSLAAIQAQHDGASAELDRLRARLDRETDENRARLVEILERMAAAAAEKPQERRKRLFGWLRRPAA